MRRLLVVILTASLALLGAACGDDEERLSQAEFETQGNKICSDGNDRLEKVFEDAGFDEEEPSPEEVEQVIDDEVVPSIEQQIEDLRDLNPPEDIEDEFEQLLDDAEQAVEELGDMSGEELFSQDESDDPFADVNAQSEELGLTACAE